MPTIQIKKDTPTLWKIWFYTWQSDIVSNRWEYMERDIAISKITLTDTLVYIKDRPSQPDKKLTIQSFSYPQYKPYINVKGKKSNKQRKIRHQYDLIFVLQKDNKGEYSFQSKIRWHVGSFKKWKKAPQNQIKSVRRETRERLKRKYGQTKRYTEEVEKIRKKGKYLDNGDYNSRVEGLNGDFYFTGNPLCYTQNCSFGPVINKELNTRKPFNEIKFPFFGKHELAVLLYLFKKGIIKNK